MSRWIGTYAVIIAITGCAIDSSSHGLGPLAPSLAKGGNGGQNDGDGLVVDFVAGDFAGDNLVLSTCAGDSEASYNVRFGNTDDGTNAGCLTITTSDGTQIVDDIYFTSGVKSGSATRVTFWGQDAAGLSGIQHQSEPASVNPPAPTSTAGFTVHVHATDVVVWRLNGHLSSKKVRRVGTVDIGDIIYRIP